VKSVTVAEPEWTEQDRAEILALGMWRAQQCPLHGGPLAECTSHEDDGPQFRVSKRRCRAHDEVLLAQDGLQNTVRPGALLWTVTRVDKVGR
jgi:hypothetical protein